MNKQSIKVAKKVTLGKRLEEELKHNVYSDLIMIYRESYLDEEDTKTLIESTIELTIDNLSKLNDALNNEGEKE